MKMIEYDILNVKMLSIFSESKPMRTAIPLLSHGHTIAIFLSFWVCMTERVAINLLLNLDIIFYQDVNIYMRRCVLLYKHNYGISRLIVN